MCDFCGRMNSWMKNLIINLDLSVSYFIDFENSGRRVDILNESFSSEDLNSIMKIFQ